jgi:hypothetical protein
LAKLLYKATSGGELEPMVWGKKQKKAFKKLKRYSQMPLLWACKM